MNAIPNTQHALNTTAEDLRQLGAAARTDLQHLAAEARDIVQERVIDPSRQMVRDTKRVLEDQTHRSVEAARVQIDHLRGYVEANPVRVVAGALAGGLILGYLLRR